MADDVTDPGTYGAIGSNADFEVESITGTGLLYVGVDLPGNGYSDWAMTNVNNQTVDQDFNGDGVDNGIAYFMDETGMITLPGIVGGAVTWTNGGNIAASEYETRFVIQTSPNLATWTDIEATDPNLDNTTGAVTYTIPTGMSKLFTRLVVTPN